MAEDREVRQKLLNDPDFILAPRYGNSLATWLGAQKEDEPKKLEARTRAAELAVTRAAKMLGMSVEDLEEVRDEALAFLREEMADFR